MGWDACLAADAVQDQPLLGWELGQDVHDSQAVCTALMTWRTHRSVQPEGAEQKRGICPLHQQCRLLSPESLLDIWHCIVWQAGCAALLLPA